MHAEPILRDDRSPLDPLRNAQRAVTGGPYGLVHWEETIAKVLSKKGYATGHFGKWGPPHSYDEALWEQDPWYLPGRDPVAHILEATKGQAPQSKELLACDVKVHLDVESGQPIERRPVRHVPLVGEVAAGTGVLAAENIE